MSTLMSALIYFFYLQDTLVSNLIPLKTSLDRPDKRSFSVSLFSYCPLSLLASVVLKGPFEMKNNNQRHEQDPVKIISVEGLNGAGKTVFTSKLKEQLEVLGFQVLVIKAPLYEMQNDNINHYGPEIHAHLNQRPQTVRGDTIETQSPTIDSLPSIDEMFRINRLYIQEHIIDK